MAPFNWSAQPVGSRAPNSLSMLIFYINRGGKNLPGRRKNILEQAKSRIAPSVRSRVTRPIA
jgi:hypothetical protein